MTCGSVCSVVGYVWDAFAMFIGLFPDLCAATLNNKLCSCWYFSFAPSSTNSGALHASISENGGGKYVLLVGLSWYYFD
jgi:hypothetical protein